MRRLNFLVRREEGNIFLAIFGAVAMVGLLGASVMTFMKGPLSTSVKLTKINTAESQMTIGAQVAVMAAANQAGSGDCDADGTVEPIEWRAPTGSEPVPTGGGLVPLSLGINKRDPWGTEYGYCVWNHGTVLSGSGCGTNLRQGTNGTAYSVVALVSAGPDKTFTTTCRDFAVADANSNGLLEDGEEPLVSKNLETDDDIITTFTYEEATGVSGGLWSLKAGDPNTAVINKSIESSGVANLKGGVLLPDKSLIDCNDITNAGVMAKNGTTGIEICDGTGTWTAITGGGVTGNNLVLTPVTSTAMNVTGTCGTPTCYSAQVTFTLTNKAASTSPVLASSLSNTTNFEFVSNGCNGVTLATNAECQMVVRAKATGNISYTGTVNITGGNSPFATLSGTASSFPGCNAGGQAPGGYYLACGVSGAYNLITTPSGCSSGNTNPTCSGGNTDLFGVITSPTIDLTPYIDGCCGASDGAQNTANLMAYSTGAANFPAASWCAGLVYRGFDDWYLPSINELSSYFYPNRNVVQWGEANYWSSTMQNFSAGWWYYMDSTGTNSNAAPGNNTGLFVRCMRRDPISTINPTVDTTPNTFNFNTSYGGPSETRTSNTIYLYHITQPISVSVSGGTSTQFSINGGAYSATSRTAQVGDSITVRTTSPAQGQESVISVTTGSISTSWLVRTQGSNLIRVFTTSATAGNGTIGVGGADSICTARASTAGLPGSWTAMIAGTGVKIENRLPWNWSTLKNMNGQTVATSLSDFLDGSTLAPMNYSETGGVTTGTVWTGLYNSGGVLIGGPYDASTCNNFASTSGSLGRVGDSAQTGGFTYLSNATASCGANYRILCIETNAAGADLDPDDLTFTPGITFASGATTTSNIVVVKGVTNAVPVSISVSGGTASIIKNNINLNTTSTTAGLNESLSFTLTAPTTIGTKNTATINIGPDSYTWWVGYADQAKTVRGFVTSTTRNAGYGGLAAADGYCNQVAGASSIGLSGSWKALLSDSTTAAVSRIPWNWGTLVNPNGQVIVDGGVPDLLDGTFDDYFNVNENGTVSTANIWTGSDQYGNSYSPSGNSSQYFSYDWTSGVCCGPTSSYGEAGSRSSTAMYRATASSDNTNLALRCIENVDSVTDTIPGDINLTYIIQAPLSSRQSSTQIAIGSMSSGATTTLSVSASAGNPRFTINGGSQVSSGTVRNGDKIVFFMDSPSTASTSNLMTITGGGQTLGIWRIWSGWDGVGSGVKRVFLSSTTSAGNVGGVAGFDGVCQSAAAAAGFGGTWKAIASGIAETDFAVNRVGYNWNELRTVSGTLVTYAGGLWNTLLSPIVVTELGVAKPSFPVWSNTTSNGRALSSTSERYYNNLNWTVSTCGNVYTGSSSSTRAISVQDSYGCALQAASYCIEQ